MNLEKFFEEIAIQMIFTARLCGKNDLAWSKSIGIPLQTSYLKTMNGKDDKGVHHLSNYSNVY